MSEYLCPNCLEQSTESDVCSDCNTSMSVADDSLDKLVAQASVPNLAALFAAGKAAGLITAQVEYGHTP
jgi:hypothetical protein